MPYTILLTPTATDDVDAAIEYYNALAADLGYRFADKFPFVITYTVNDVVRPINILRVFNTYQEPLW